MINSRSTTAVVLLVGGVFGFLLGRTSVDDALSRRLSDYRNVRSIQDVQFPYAEGVDAIGNSYTGRVCSFVTESDDNRHCRLLTVPSTGEGIQFQISGTINGVKSRIFIEVDKTPKHLSE